MPITPRHLVGFMFDSHFAADFGKKNSMENIGLRRKIQHKSNFIFKLIFIKTVVMFLYFSQL